MWFHPSFRRLDAARLLRLAAADCPKSFAEFIAANAELKKLEQLDENTFGGNIPKLQGFYQERR